VERRAGAKENTIRCRACRTQGRESVSQAPERVRGQPSTSEVGAVCGQAARTVLCGGRSVMGVPTAISLRKARFAGTGVGDRNLRAYKFYQEAAVHFDLFCSASHSIEPMAQTVLTGCGLLCASSLAASWR